MSSAGRPHKWGRLLAREADEVLLAVQVDLKRPDLGESQLPRLWKTLQRWAYLRSIEGRRAGYTLRRRAEVKKMEVEDAEAQ